MLGLSLEMFTFIHVAISLVAAATGFIVVGGLLRNHRMPGWTAVFLFTTVLTSVTGFMFPFHQFLPSHGTGVVSLLVLAPALIGLYVFDLHGRWRAVYVAGAVAALYLNCFVLVVQMFLRLPALNALAPTQAEAPFAIAQGLLLVAFAVLGYRTVRSFRPA